MENRPSRPCITDLTSKDLYLAAEMASGFRNNAAKVALYFSIPGGGAANSFTDAASVLGFPGEVKLELNLADGSTQIFASAGGGAWTPLEGDIRAAIGDQGIELAIPLTLLSNADTGDQLSLRAYYQQAGEINEEAALHDLDQIPSQGPAKLAVPDLGNTRVVLDVADPQGDDYGPGTYTYPTDTVFNSGNFDILDFQIGSDQDNIVFKFVMRGPVDNPWGSPNGLALQTFDIYIDKDHNAEGGHALLPGRNLALDEGFAWDYAVHVEGWTAGVYASNRRRWH